MRPSLATLALTSRSLLSRCAAITATAPLLQSVPVRAMSAAAMSKRLEGKTVLITGASSGIGRSTALEFARTAPRSLKLVLTARRLERVQELAEQIRREIGEGVQVHAVQQDVSKPAEVKGFLGRLPAEFREVDVLVNNA